MLCPCTNTFSKEGIYTLNNGTLKIFSKPSSQIKLDGEWNFIADAFISPDSISKDLLSKAKKLNVPGTWGKNDYGAGSYILKFTGLSYIYSPLLKIEEIRSSFSLYIKDLCPEVSNSTLLSQCGIPSLSPDSSSALFKEVLSHLPSDCDSGYLIFHVSNYSVSDGGIKFPIFLGSFNSIKKNRDFDRAINFTIIGIILFMAFHHIFLFFNLRHKRAYLYFGIFSIFMGLYNYANQGFAFEKIETPNEYLFSLILKSTYLTLIIGFPFFLSFLSNIFHNEFSKKIEKVFWYISLFFLSTLLLPLYILEKLFLFYQIALLLMTLYSMLNIFRAVLNHRSASKISFIGFLIFLFTVIHDVLLDNLFINSIWLGAYGMTAFIISQSAVLSKLFAKTHREMEYLSKNLELEVEKKTEALQIAHKQLEKEAESKTNVFVNLAHEIKTPLAIINNHIHTLSENKFNERELNEIKFYMNLLISQITNFLDSEKIRRGSIEYDHSKPLDLSYFLTQKLPGFKKLAHSNELDISDHIQNNIFSRIDVHAFDRIINNLLDNAIKYNQPDGTISVKLTEENELITIKVEDNGIGISNDRINEIFDPYKQVSSTKRNKDGLGMGLHITREIIESVNGTITVNSKPGKGSSFIITLKSCAPTFDQNNISSKFITIPQDISINEKIDDHISKNHFETILLVEDNNSLLKSLKEILISDYNILVANNGQRALSKLNECTTLPSLIISDIMMDEMDGITFQKKLLEDKNYKNIPFIFLTAKSDEEESIKGLESGAVDYLAKPFSIPILKAKIKSLLNFSTLKNSIMENERYRSLGILTSTISHEIMNPLMGINGPLDVLKNCISDGKITEPKIVDESIKFITTNLNRIESIVNTLKSMNTKIEIIEEINFNEFLKPIIKLFSEKNHNSIKFIQQVPKDYRIKSNASVLSQIFINLISNAIDAIEDFGTVTIKVIPDKNTITITDTGTGIAENHIDRIFDFSFTTKDQSKGTGVGLFIVKRLCNQLNVDISVESSIDKGSTFTLKFNSLANLEK